MNFTQPTQTKFTEAQSSLTNLMQDYSAQIDVKKGSVVRELLIRPFAYLYAKVDDIISRWIRDTSVAYLSQSTQTQNQIADLVASNYFVTRKQGSHATGVITLTCSQSQIRVNAGAGFMIDSHIFDTSKAYIATMSPIESTDDIGYVQMYQIGDAYKANIPVEAQQTGSLQIPAGVQVQITSYIAGAESAQLLSPITGGSSTETDAQMMARCKDRCGAAIGTVEAIRTKLQDAPVNVVSCNAIGSQQPGCFRSRYNNLAIPYGSAVDIYVKTSNQNAVKQLEMTSLEQDSDSKWYFQLSSLDYPEIAGFCRIAEITTAAGGSAGRYTISYESYRPAVSDIGARNTVYQKAKVTFQSLQASTTMLATVQYMPGVSELQNYMDSTYEKYLGQDCLVKAAVPATVKLKCRVYTKSQMTDTQLTQLKTFIAAQINMKYVGDYNLNMDQIAQNVQLQYPDLRMRLPYTLSIELPMTNGGVYSFSTTDGTASLLYRTSAYHWATGAYFYSTTPDYIQLQVIS